jgi:hypothetical protein
VDYPRNAAEPALSEDRYVLKRQLLKLFGGGFKIFDANGEQVLQANQKAFRLKEDIRLLGGPGLHQEVIGVFARHIIDFSAAYDVVDLTNNTKLGALRRKGFHSLVRDEWDLLDAHDGPIGSVMEDSVALGLIRRFATSLIPQNYDIMVGGHKVVDLRQNFNPFNYHLHIDFLVPASQFDRRIGLAAAVLIATIEGRQQREG